MKAVTAPDAGAGWTALHAAASRRGRRQDVAALVDAGADPNALTADGMTPLHRAAPNTRAVLLAAGADPNARAKHPNSVGVDGWTPLHVAASQGDTETIAALLAAGADPSARDWEGKTPPGLGARRAGVSSGTARPRAPAPKATGAPEARPDVKAIVWVAAAVLVLGLLALVFGGA